MYAAVYRKSVDLRSHILSHLRKADEANMLRKPRTSAISAPQQLLKAQMIKQQLPLVNLKLRRNKQLCGLRLQGSLPEVVHWLDIDFAQTPNLFGLFASHHAALEALRNLADMHQLHYARLGVEHLSRVRAWFRHIVKLCVGACCGQERSEQHDACMAVGWRRCV